MSGIRRTIPTNAYLAALAANNPSGVNAFATLIDVLGSGGNRVITGNASYSGTGFTYDVSALTYIIQGALYTSAATQVTLGASDPTFDRIDVIYADDTGSVGVIAGTPAAVPAKPSVDNLTQVEVTFVTVGAGTTSPTVTIVDIYDENLGVGGGEWNTSTTSPNVTLNDTTDPYQGTIHIGTTGSFGPNRNIIFDDSPYTINGGQLSFWLKAKSNMGIISGKFFVGFFVGGTIVGNAVQIGGTPSSTYGFSGGVIGTYQLVTIPIADFGSLPASIDQLRVFTLGGANTAQFDMDVVKIEEGVPTPGPAPIYLDDLTDVSLDFDTQAAVQEDDGKLAFYDINAGEFITDPLVNHTSRVINSKKGPFPGTIAKGLAVYLTGFDSDLHTVELAAAGDVNKMPVIGITGEPLNNTDSKHVVIAGLITGLDTSGAVSGINPNGETWAEGDALYMSITPGGLTNVRPTGGSVVIQEVARVVDVDASGGKILLMDSHEADLPNIDTDYMWKGSVSGTPQAFRNNFNSATDPSGTDDALSGYTEGSVWVNVITNKAYICVDANPTTALWVETTQAGGGGGGGWNPTAITLGDFVANGATAALNVGAGYYYNFDATSDDEIVVQIGLARNGVTYDASSVRLDLHNMLVGAGGVGDTVLWEVDYAWTNTGDNAYTAIDGTITNSVNVNGRASQILFTDSLTIPAGTAGDDMLQLTIRRNSQGGGSDTFGGSVEVYGVDVVKL